MSQVLHYMMELEELNLGSIPEKSLCVDHIDDGAIKRFIKQNYISGYCDYCERPRKVIELEDLMRHVMSFINEEYTDAGNVLGHDSKEGGYLGRTLDEYDLVETVGLDIIDGKLSDDVIASIADLAWVEKDYYGTTPLEDLVFDWKWFKETIKHNNRFIFLMNKKKATKEQIRTRATIQNFGSTIRKFKLIKEIPKSTVFYRCRATSKRKYYRSKVDLITPPNSVARFANRFSPSGIGMFYAAFDSKTAMLETISSDKKKNSYASVGRFVNTKPLRLLDLTELPDLFSFFSLRRGNKYYERQFLHHLVTEMSRGVKKDGMEHIEYIPTQVITEYLRFVFKDKTATAVDGIIYPSSKDWKSKSVVIFADHNRSNVLFDLRNVAVEKLSSAKKIKLVGSSY